MHAFEKERERGEVGRERERERERQRQTDRQTDRQTEPSHDLSVSSFITKEFWQR